jgi:hypothetical protein
MKNIILLLAIVLLAGCAWDVSDGRDGKDGQDGLPGLPGRDGTDGSDGLPGVPGAGCTVSQRVDGSIITCADGSMAIIMNGQDGSDSVMEVISPCEGSGSHELLLRMANNKIIAHYSHGSSQHLRYITPGTWQLTDGTQCIFTVHNDLSVTW